MKLPRRYAPFVYGVIQAALTTAVATAIATYSVMGIALAAVFVEWRESVYGHDHAGMAAAFVDGYALLALIFFLAMIVSSRMRRPAEA